MCLCDLRWHEETKNVKCVCMSRVRHRIYCSQSKIMRRPCRYTTWSSHWERYQRATVRAAALPATCCVNTSVTTGPGIAHRGEVQKETWIEKKRELERGGKECQGSGHAREITHCPPKSCMPSRAKTTMKRKRRKSKLMMDFMELRRETTRFRREFQYLRESSNTERDNKFIQMTDSDERIHTFTHPILDKR